VFWVHLETSLVEASLETTVVSSQAYIMRKCYPNCAPPVTNVHTTYVWVLCRCIYECPHVSLCLSMSGEAERYKRLSGKGISFQFLACFGTVPRKTSSMQQIPHLHFAVSIYAC
jgi:hypothetical protein